MEILFKKIAKKSSDEVGRLNAELSTSGVNAFQSNSKSATPTSSSLTGDNRSDFYATQYFSH